MTQKHDPIAPFIISRLFNAPRAKVFAAWTQIGHLAKWFGPKGVSITASTLDLCPGGTFHYCMKTPDGHEMWGLWQFLEVQPPERLVLVSSFSDKDGGLTRHPTSATWPLKTLSTTTFADQGGETLLTVEWLPHDTATEEERQTFDGARAGMMQGWGGTMEQLEAWLAAEQGDAP